MINDNYPKCRICGIYLGINSSGRDICEQCRLDICEAEGRARVMNDIKVEVFPWKKRPDTTG